MGVFIGEATMLYCPKCRRSYEEGSQRFCPSDGGRLLPALPSANNAAGGKTGVFSTIIGRRMAEKTAAGGETLPTPQFLKVEKTEERKSQTPAPPGKNFKTELEIQPKFEPPQPTKTAEEKPAARLVKPSEIASGTAPVGDRLGRPAVSWENPDVLLGQTVKGRYRVTEKIGEDETSLSFVADDQLARGRKVVVRVLMEEDADDLEGKIFAEERVRLSHLNHPNIPALLDSGELPEGKPFIVSEYAAGESVAEKIRRSGQFNAMRAARIVRQTADALSEAHRNGILHRNLKPENIILTVNEAGTEVVKVTGFAVSDGRAAKKISAYQSPEQLEGKLPTSASDLYSLAVIAFQMLTNRLPFNDSAGGDKTSIRKRGLALKPTNLRLDLPPLADEILEKALAYKPADRYPKARDFGDAFFNALTTVSPLTKKGEKPEQILPPRSSEIKLADWLEDVEIELIEEEAEAKNLIETQPEVEEKTEAAKDETRSAADASAAIAPTKTAEDLPWEKRSPEPIQVASKSWMRLSVLGLLALVLGLWAVWYYFLNRPDQPAFNPQNQAATQQENPAATTETPVNPIAPTPVEEIEAPPPERRGILPPPNSEYFQNTRENLSGELAKYYRGFSFFYPKDWERLQGGKNFVDVARKNENGVPIEQMLVTYYDSKGTFKADSEKFPTLVKETNEKLGKQIQNYRFISEGEKIINGGWKVYEMKFEATTQTKDGQNIKLYGRRIFMPAMRPAVKSGFMITLLATSLAPQIKSADDVGVKGELATVLGTFEPSQIY